MPRPDAAAPAPVRLGLVVNPVAGLGGRVGLKGSDGEDVQRRATELGAVPQAGARTIRALRRLISLDGLEVLAAPGAMGADLAQAVGLRTTVLPGRATGTSAVRSGPTGAAGTSAAGPVAPGRGTGVSAARSGPPGRATGTSAAGSVLGDLGGVGRTTAEDTTAAVRALARHGVDLILFAGGDGTACDVHDVVGARVPVLGIPTGVKMHSGVFAASPEAAGEAAAAWLADPRADALRDADVADIDEAAVRDDRIATRLHGHARVPRDRARVLAAKGATPRRADAELDGACARTLADLAPGTLVLVGPGTTAGRALTGLGLGRTLLGIDAVRDGLSVGTDLDERSLLRLLDDADRAVLLLGVVGGQGALLGRGNQQLSPAVLRRVGRDGLRVVAGREKLAALSPDALRVDTGDPELDRDLAGHLPVRVSARETVVMPVAP